MNIPLDILGHNSLQSVSKLLYAIILDDASKSPYCFYSSITPQEIASVLNTSLLIVRLGMRNLYVEGLIERRLNSDGKKVYHLVKLESDLVGKFFDGLETVN